MESGTAPHAGDGKARGAVFSEDPGGVFPLKYSQEKNGVEKSNERGEGSFSLLPAFWGDISIPPSGSS